MAVSPPSAGLAALSCKAAGLQVCKAALAMLGPLFCFAYAHMNRMSGPSNWTGLSFVTGENGPKKTLPQEGPVMQSLCENKSSPGLA